MKKAVVLSGGGAKGAYEIGVWKALRKLHINYNIVTGTSVGALNAALMVQKSYFSAVKLWNNLNFSFVFDENIDFDYTTKKGKRELMKLYVKNAINGGTNIENLEKTVNDVINIDKIYNSNIDMGIVTVKLPQLKPIELIKKEIPKDKLKDYLIASASCYPAFQKKEIDGEDYIDGGFYDNLPINLAIKLGAEEIIAVDLQEIGLKQRIKSKKVKITIIKPRNDIGSFLVFDSKIAKRAIKLGYNDTMKEFKCYDGYIYTFKKKSFDKYYNKYKNIYIKYLNEILKFEKKVDIIDKLFEISAFKRILSNRKETELKKEFINIIENIGLMFDLDETKVYDIRKYNQLLLSNLSLIDNNKNTKIQLASNQKYKINYILNKLREKDSKKNLNNLAILFPKEFLQAMYLNMLINNK